MSIKYTGLPPVAIRVARLFWQGKNLARIARKFELSAAQCREYAFEVRLRDELWEAQSKAVRTLNGAGARHRARARRQTTQIVQAPATTLQPAAA
jgi:hypothetical protein